MYEFKLQKRNGGHRVVMVETANNKLVLAGETIKRLIDATEVANKCRSAYNDKRSMMLVTPLEVLPLNYKFSKNSGPKKSSRKVAVTKGLKDTALAMVAGRPAGRSIKKDRFAKTWAKELKSAPKKAAKKMAKKK